MQNIFDQLIKLLKKDERLVSSDDNLLKNQIQELARKNDSKLIKLNNEEKNSLNCGQKVAPDIRLLGKT